VQIGIAPLPNPEPNSTHVFELRKPCEPLLTRSRKGVPLSWDGRHPKLKDLLFTEGTLQQLSSDHAEYAQVLITGDNLEPRLSLPAWRSGRERIPRSPTSHARSDLADVGVLLGKIYEDWPFSGSAASLTPGGHDAIRWTDNE
jgi:hypothetical protein